MFWLHPFQVPSANVYLATAGWFWRLGWIEMTQHETQGRKVIQGPISSTLNETLLGGARLEVRMLVNGFVAAKSKHVHLGSNRCGSGSMQ